MVALDHNSLIRISSNLSAPNRFHWRKTFNSVIVDMRQNQTSMNYENP